MVLLNRTLKEVILLKVSMKAARVNVDMTQKQAAEAVNVSETTIIKWESGASIPPADKFMRLCEIYGATVDDIVLPKRYCETELSEESA